MSRRRHFEFGDSRGQTWWILCDNRARELVFTCVNRVLYNFVQINVSWRFDRYCCFDHLWNHLRVNTPINCGDVSVKLIFPAYLIPFDEFSACTLRPRRSVVIDDKIVVNIIVMYTCLQWAYLTYRRTWCVTQSRNHIFIITTFCINRLLIINTRRNRLTVISATVHCQVKQYIICVQATHTRVYVYNVCIYNTSLAVISCA